MSSETNQSSTPSGDQHVAGLDLLFSTTISDSYKTVRDTFLGRDRPAEQKEAESDEVTNVEGHENLPPQDKQELG